MTKKLSSKERLVRMNDDHAVVQIGGKVRIASWERSEIHPAVSVPVFSTVAEMKVLYANQFVEVKLRDGDGNEEVKRRALFPHWLERGDRPTARGVTMDASGGRFVDDRLNLWQGFGAEPKPGDWPHLRQHIVEVLCSGNEEHANYLIRWCAWRVQNPTLPPEVALVFGGAKGAGKGKFARGVLCRIFGAHSIQISDRKHLTGSFNAHMMQCCLLFADEAFWPGDKEGDGPLKRLITEPTLFIEMKGVDAVELPNRLAVVIAGNEDWLIPASGDERRYAVFKVSDAHAQDLKYFAALDAELNSGGIEAFLHDMQTMDLADWHPRQDVPQTQALGRQKVQSASNEELWLEGILVEGALPRVARDPATGNSVDVVVAAHPSRARSRALWWHAKASASRPAYFMSEPAFREWLKGEGVIEGQRDKHSSTKEFGSLSQARARWNAKRPWWPIADDGKEWRLGERRAFSLLDVDEGDWSEQDEEAVFGGTEKAD